MGTGLFGRAGEYLDRRYLLKKRIYRVLILLLMINFSNSVLPGSFILSYGLYGELVSVSAAENQESAVYPSAAKDKPDRPCKTRAGKELKQLQYTLLLFVIAIRMIRYLQYRTKCGNDKTPVGLKVRMNN